MKNIGNRIGKPGELISFSEVQLTDGNKVGYWAIAKQSGHETTVGIAALCGFAQQSIEVLVLGEILGPEAVAMRQFMVAMMRYDGVDEEAPDSIGGLIKRVPVVRKFLNALSQQKAERQRLERLNQDKDAAKAAQNVLQVLGPLTGYHGYVEATHGPDPTKVHIGSFRPMGLKLLRDTWQIRPTYQRSTTHDDATEPPAPDSDGFASGLGAEDTPPAGPAGGTSRRRDG